MRFSISQVGPEGLDLELAEDQMFLEQLLGLPEQADGPLPVRADGPLRVECRVLAPEDDLLISGRIRCDLQVACRRCLEFFPVALDLPFGATCRPASALPTEEEVELEAEDLEVVTYRGDQIDLTDTVREQILLGAPAYPLCREDCAGLCQRCGANRNTEPCGCETEPLDPRWAKLKDVKIDPGSR